MWMGDAVRIRISTMEQIKASPGADIWQAQHRAGLRRRRAATHPLHSSFSVVQHVWAVRKDRPQVTHRGIETDGGIEA